jgi:hypothetical protein
MPEHIVKDPQVRYEPTQFPRVRLRDEAAYVSPILMCVALLSELTRLASSHRGRLHPGFRRFGHPPRRRISLQCQLGNLHWQDFHLLDHQLASLREIASELGVDGIAELPVVPAQ